MADSKSETTLKQKLVMDEIAGKNNAIQTYDQILWKIRSGYLTLLFAGWGALLSLIGNKPELLKPITAAMVCVSVGLSAAGLVIDINYIKRKYRSIYALGILIQEAFRSIDKPDNLKNQHIWLRISGDDIDAQPAAGFWSAVIVALMVYIVPVLSITLGVIASFRFFL
ncbi:MAG: hypothetical protein ACYTBX_18310 [Planctomycetota bacterium]|jgi:hypothetical protein